MSLPLGQMGTLRSISASLMPETVEVLRNQRVSDGEGGWVTASVIATTYKGRYKTAGYRELQIASQMTDAVDGVITLPHNAVIQGSDKLRRNGVEYWVSGIMDQTKELSADLRVLVRRA